MFRTNVRPHIRHKRHLYSEDGSRFLQNSVNLYQFIRHHVTEYGSRHQFIRHHVTEYGSRHALTSSKKRVKILVLKEMCNMHVDESESIRKCAVLR
jgi:hypothetical protein